MPQTTGLLLKSQLRCFYDLSAAIGKAFIVVLAVLSLFDRCMVCILSLLLILSPRGLVQVVVILFCRKQPIRPIPRMFISLRGRHDLHLLDSRI